MLRQVSIVALAVFAGLASLAVAAAQESKPASGKTKSPPKEIAVDLGKGVKLELVLIPAGEFLMGSPDADKDADGNEKPQHRVRITKPFYLGKYLVTQEQWEAVMGSNPSDFKGPKNPVEWVSWDDCQQFLKQAQREVRRRGREVLAADRGPMGICLPRGEHDQVLLWRRRRQPWRVRLVRRQLGRQDASGGREKAERLGALRHARKPVPVVRRIGTATTTTSRPPRATPAARPPAPCTSTAAAIGTALPAAAARPSATPIRRGATTSSVCAVAGLCQAQRTKRQPRSLRDSRCEPRRGVGSPSEGRSPGTRRKLDSGQIRARIPCRQGVRQCPWSHAKKRTFRLCRFYRRPAVCSSLRNDFSENNKRESIVASHKGPNRENLETRCCGARR